MDKLIGFSPDADPTTPGVFTNVTNCIPFDNGMQGAPVGVTPSGVPALAAACIGGAVITKLDDTRRIFAGTTTKLYELSGGSWTDVSTGSYTGGTDTRWQFAQFGNASLASNLTDTIQRSNGSGAFSAIGTAPKARIIFTVGAFVMALNTIDGTYGTSQDRWWCCAASDETSWTPSVTTLATTGRLVSAPGQLLAGGRLGEYAVAYKERAIYVGQFIGAPAVWDWLQVPGGEAGCVGQDAWCAIGIAHFIVGADRFWRFDGSRPVPIGDGLVTRWFNDNVNPAYRYKTKCFYDAQNGNVWVFYCHGASTTNDKALVYHLKTDQWGKVDISIEAAMQYIAAGVTIDGLTSYSATIDGLSGTAFDSQFWLSGGRALSVFNTSHQLQLLTGSTSTSSFTTGDGGDDDVVSLLKKIRLRFITQPTSATVQTYTKMNSGEAYSAASMATLSDGRFDILDSARWHQAVVSLAGDYKLTGIGAELIPEGDV